MPSETSVGVRLGDIVYSNCFPVHARLVDAPAPWVALVGLLLLAAVGATGRPGLEVGAAAAAAPVALAGLTGAADDVLLTWAAVYLTVAGAAISGVALARPNRRLAGWAGGLLLVAATWVRLYDVGVTTPEAYTLPSAVALLAVGSSSDHSSDGTSASVSPGPSSATVPDDSRRRRCHNPTASSATALGSV